MNGNEKIHRIIAQQFIDMIEGGMVNDKWKAPWNQFASTLPQNFTSKREYNGINIFMLWAQGHASPYWGTYKQWKEAGAQVKKGEKGTMVVFWKILESKKKFDNNGNPETFPMLRYSKVFNAEQVEGWTAPETSTTQNETNDIHRYCDEIIRQTGADIRHGGNRACFIPSLDVIHMPEFNSFIDADYYYQTLFHELAHWTGHESRLNRSFGKRFGDHEYALEELLAELASAIACAKAGIETTTRDDHAKYIKGWLEALKAEPASLMTVASKANKAVDYIMNPPKENEQAEAA